MIEELSLFRVPLSPWRTSPSEHYFHSSGVILQGLGVIGIWWSVDQKCFIWRNLGSGTHQTQGRILRGTCLDCRRLKVWRHGASKVHSPMEDLAGGVPWGWGPQGLGDAKPWVSGLYPGLSFSSAVGSLEALKPLAEARYSQTCCRARTWILEVLGWGPRACGSREVG